MLTGLASQRLAPGSAHLLCCVSYRPHKTVPNSPTFPPPWQSPGFALLLYDETSETEAKRSSTERKFLATAERELLGWQWGEGERGGWGAALTLPARAALGRDAGEDGAFTRPPAGTLVPEALSGRAVSSLGPPEPHGL